MKNTRSATPDDQKHNDRETAQSTLTDGLRTLPLVADDIYLQMQAFNLGVVDSILTDWERELLIEYHALETRLPSMAVVVSAVAQLWVFGLYELLRTWRQRVREVLEFTDSLDGLAHDERTRQITKRKTEIRQRAVDPEHPNPAHSMAYERAEQDVGFCRELRQVLDRSEAPFRDLEAVRVHLAKHEIPRKAAGRATYPSMPGYGRIDQASGSICWHVELGEYHIGKQVQIFCRSALARSCATFASDESILILSRQLQEQIKPLPRFAYGIKKVLLVLADGSTREAIIAWDRQVVGVVDDLPFTDPASVVDVRAT